MSTWQKIGAAVGGLIGLVLVGLIAFRILFVNLVDNYEVGYTYDLRSGKLEVLKDKGYIITPPIVVEVHTVDLRPMQVCLNANNRVLNCKLVKFNPDGLENFLSLHGRNNYHSSNQSNFNQIMMSYAFDESGKVYPFLTVLNDLKVAGRPGPTGLADASLSPDAGTVQ